MNRNQVFGELRGLLFRPSKENWEGICRLVESLPETQQREEVVPYLQHHLARWPVDVCMAPWHWIQPLFDGDDAPPALGLARAVEIVERKNIHHGFRRFVRSPAISHIESLKVDSAKIGGKRSFDVLAEVDNLRNLSMLSLERIEMEDEYLEAILNAGHVHGVRELHLEGNNLSPQSVSMLLEHQFVLDLEELHLDGNPIGSNGCALLARAPFERLKVLSLGTTGIGDEGLAFLSSSEHFRDVTRLELAQCDIGPGGMHALVNGSNWDSVDTLSIWSNHIGGLGVEHIARREGMPNLSHLGLSNNDVDDSGMIALAESEYSAHIKKLDVRLNAIGERGCEAFGASSHLGGLEALFLSFNPCQTDGIVELFRDPSWTNLRQLELANTRISDLDALGQCEQLQHLEELELTGNWLNSGMEGLVDSPYLSNLRMLGLDHCSLRDDTLQLILDDFHMPNMIALFLSRNKLTDVGAKRLMDHSFERLLLLDITHNDDMDPLFVKHLQRKYRVTYQKRVWSSGSSLHYTLSVLDDAAEPIWETLSHEVIERRKLNQQLGSVDRAGR